MSGKPRQSLAEPVAFRVFDLATKEACRHLMSFVNYDQIPIEARSFELALQVLVSAELIEAADGQRMFEKPVPRCRRLQSIIGEDVESNRIAARVRPAIAQL